MEIKIKDEHDKLKSELGKIQKATEEHNSGKMKAIRRKRIIEEENKKFQLLEKQEKEKYFENLIEGKRNNDLQRKFHSQSQHVQFSSNDQLRIVCGLYNR